MRLILAALVAVFSYPAFAQSGGQACGEYPEVLSYLKDKYGEQPVGRGLDNGGRMAELFTSREGTTWTLVITYPNGVACLLDAGDDWEQVKAQWGDGS